MCQHNDKAGWVTGCVVAYSDIISSTTLGARVDYSLLPLGRYSTATEN
jgi:hypothetical protein